MYQQAFAPAHRGAAPYGGYAQTFAYNFPPVQYPIPRPQTPATWELDPQRVSRSRFFQEQKIRAGLQNKAHEVQESHGIRNILAAIRTGA